MAWILKISLIWGKEPVFGQNKILIPAFMFQADPSCEEDPIKMESMDDLHDPLSLKTEDVMQEEEAQQITPMKMEVIIPTTDIKSEIEPVIKDEVYDDNPY